MKTITTGKDLASLIDQAIVEGQKSSGLKAHLYHKHLEEKDKQDSLFGGGDDEKDASDTGPDDQDVDDSSGDNDEDDEKMSSGEVSVEDIIEKLNTIRSGRSFKDDEIKSSLSKYIEKLDKAERTALMAFLKGVAQITTGEVDSNDAEQPDKPAPDVHMHKGEKKQSKHVDPNVIKGAPKSVKKDKHPAEDDSGPTPIVPKKR